MKEDWIVGACCMHGKNGHKILVRKSEQKNQTVRHRPSWEESIIMNLKETGVRV
jgi:hypothetical protein